MDVEARELGIPRFLKWLPRSKETKIYLDN